MSHARSARSTWAIVHWVVTMALFCVAIGIAILRYRLFEIDRLVSRTIASVVITAFLVPTIVPGLRERAR